MVHSLKWMELEDRMDAAFSQKLSRTLIAVGALLALSNCGDKNEAHLKEVDELALRRAELIQYQVDRAYRNLSGRESSLSPYSPS
ncbi:MAG: hypothetical protein EOP09_08120, partial [Proteobacteria bacterium]